MPFTHTKRKFWTKFIAVFFLFTFLNQLFWPTAAWALTSGPTAPEATSFEPIDTTDMVNPLTGDFTYNLPLLEVPGPEGGYPLSLSYHAGIQPNEEASWVGLGWTLNPGAITRNVNGYADDFHDVPNTTRTYWDGGETKEFGIDVGVGLGPASVSVGLSFSQDTYRGFGVGFSQGIGVGLGDSPFSIGLSMGVSPYGESYAGANIGVAGKLGKSGLVASAGIGISTNFEKTSVGGGAGISYSDGDNSFSLLGASMSSSSSKGSLTVGGGSSSVHNSKEGHIQTESSGFSTGMIPLVVIPLSVGVSYKYTRYWSDESATVKTLGTLHAPSYVNPYIYIPDYLDTHAFDTYRLLDSKNSNIVDNPDPDRLTGGTYPNYDNYNVTAQGLSGNIRPYAFQNILYTQNRKVDDQPAQNIVADQRAANITPKGKVQFRFINDFSNKYTQGAPEFSSEFNFDTPGYGKSGYPEGYDGTKNRLEGSKHIEYFTNKQINDNVAQAQGFVDTKGGGFTRGTSQEMESQIGGFMITNASGVTYHYALPAYSYKEVVYTENTKDSGHWNKLTKDAKYAYTWYLTAITGPDYVDRGVLGELDESDWGYFVRFDYGKWTDDYEWRNPSEGYQSDLDNSFKSYSAGYKELYYLDALVTRTHTALFVKSIRADGKGANMKHLPLSYNVNEHDASYQSINECTKVPVWQGGHPTQSYTTNCKRYFPKASLKLDYILLLNNNDLGTSLSSVRAASDNYNHKIYNGQTNGTPNTSMIQVHNGENVVDIFDINQALTDKCLRKIALNYDYSLSPGVPNSYDPDGSKTYKQYPEQAQPLLGKLSLLSVDFQGRGGTKTIPPIEFSYDYNHLDPANQDRIDITSLGSAKKGIIRATKAIFKQGDIIKLTNYNGVFYCTVLAKRGNDYDVIYLLKQPPGISYGVDAVITKNPPYDKDAFDIWGSYKSDYIPSSNDNLSRITSKVSSAGVDAYSLRTIRTSLGATITIGYESDSYTKSVLSKTNLVMKSAVPINGNQVKIQFEGMENMDLRDFFNINSKFELFTLVQRKLFYESRSPCSWCNRYEYNETSGKNLRYSDKDLPVLEVAATYAIVESASWFRMLSNFYSKSTFVKEVYYPNILQNEPEGRLTDEATFLGGNITLNEWGNTFGGGLRVNSVTVQSLNSQSFKTAYEYKGGVTSYEPYGLPFTNINYASLNEYQIGALKKIYLKALYNDINYLLPISREVPPPGVMYEYITVNDQVDLLDGTSTALPGKTMYQFEVFNKSLLGIQVYNNSSTAKNLSIKDYTSRVGNLKRMVTYDKAGNKLTEKITQYLHDTFTDKSFQVNNAGYGTLLSEKFDSQGLIQERYGDARSLNGTIVAIMSGRDTYPAIQTGTVQIDYRNGTKMQQQTLGFDFYSGAAIQTLTTDSYGNKFLNESRPAYREYTSMGLKVNSVANKHMLTQEAYNYTFKVNSSNVKLGVVSGSVQTWGTDVPVLDDKGDETTIGQGTIWRMKANYSWLPEGSSLNNLTPFSSFVGFDFASSASNNASWRKTGEIKKYNVYSAALEGTDINNNYAATRMGYKNSKVIVSGGPARYEEITYTGAEDALLSNGKFSGNITVGGGSISATAAHTGSKSLLIEPGQNGFNYQVSLGKLDPVKRDYTAAVWVKANGSDVTQARLYYKVDGQSEEQCDATFQKSAAGWYLLEMKIPSSKLIGSSTTSLTIGCKTIGGANGVFFDDFRFQPINAGTTAYVYDNKTSELSYILDNNNLYLKFEYDAAGRLVKTYKEVLGKTTIPLIRETSYNYANRTATGGGTVNEEFLPGMSIPRVTYGASIPAIFYNVSNKSTNYIPFPESTTFLWDFGDGTTSTQKQGNHNFAPGIYNVTLTVSHPTYGNRVFTQKVKVVRITVINHNPEEPLTRSCQCNNSNSAPNSYFTLEVEGLDMTTTATGVWDSYCESFDNEGCDADLVPRTYYSFGVYDIHEWWGTNYGCSPSAYFASGRFQFEVMDSDGDTFYSEQIITSTKTTCP